MGAVDFYCESTGATPEKAFRSARKDALYWSGHGGYSGTLAEKRSFIMLSKPAGMPLREFVYDAIDNDERVSDKWGPAGCVALGDNKFAFFGIASC